MALVPVNIPQIGEGLQEARLVATLKQPGDTVRRDEPIYQMETDKAVMDVESPYSGTLKEWLAEVDAILPIGAPVAMMEVADAVTTEVASPTAEPVGASARSSAAASPRSAAIPPRTRAYAKEK
ncbi:MAG TPA: biotin/lipoyl-containing protein, partial [Fimbriimonadaceae bacterium]|nr:biotin/lipoyl-containing protein [Fimbriimonadaceae bacterium]